MTPASLTGDRVDTVADWWTAVLGCGSLWCQNKMAEAEALYSDIDNLPDQYQVRMTDFCLNKCLIDGLKCISFRACVS